ncbi:DUF3761 domain-containing protein [Streptomyces sp. NBC_00328]|uniref:DUF3761 domain-containing protein n=1 Tax=Streptomyces sp. NBC_00328 TaxID=2903646 RepID=UPI002E29A2A1|nr:DUF3761 domain-containing protein [Streptomyces sp. NBC_00328]
MRARQQEAHVSPSSPGSASAPLHCRKAPTRRRRTVGRTPASGGSQQAPVGATALCGDGTYSYSAHRRGTCSHHGGVAGRLAGAPS